MSKALELARGAVAIGHSCDSMASCVFWREVEIARELLDEHSCRENVLDLVREYLGEFDRAEVGTPCTCEEGCMHDTTNVASCKLACAEWDRDQTLTKLRAIARKEQP